MTPACAEDFRLLAERRLPRFLFDYIDGGSYAEVTMRRNVADLERLQLRQRVLRDVSGVRLDTELLGRRVSMPLALAPIGLAGLYARRGEVQAARAAEAAGVPFILSASACCAIEEVAPAVREPLIFQLYMIKDRGFMEAMLDRARAAGVETLVMTVDLIMHSPRYRDMRSSLTGDQGFAARLKRAFEILRHPRWAWDVGVRGGPHVLGNFASAMPEGAGLAQFTAWVSRNFDPSISWDDLAWIKARWNGRLVLKGILDPDDARRAVEVGADAIVVSNHGGRQLDGAPSTIAALPAVVDAVDGRIEVLLDGGIRSGIDILRALALGAHGVLIGRAWAFALGARGGAGVSRMLEMLRQELLVAMALTGHSDIASVGPDALMRRDPDARRDSAEGRQ
ncbi:L-lactate dehydrogenase [Sphingomonas sp. ASY06-1R]|uniref:L-lactate dehydrogenase n=1 Tax=Sphingomonas sp. ASY06-1R TaxID=3445771 RepID=UPI003FA232BD